MYCQPIGVSVSVQICHWTVKRYILDGIDFTGSLNCISTSWANVNNAAIKKGNGMILINSRNINRESVNFKGSVIETVLITRMLE